jgi:hypothetical protein
MKVLNLQCRHGHAFEGWFASEDDFQSQQTRGLVQCPICGHDGVDKMPSAPRLNLAGVRSQPEQTANRSTGEESMPSPAQVESEIMGMMRRIIEKTEDVGEHFANEARKMHYGEIEHRDIRGKASIQEAVELAEEGIDVMPLSLPDHLKTRLQ